MAKTMIIVGMGSRLSLAIAKRFGQEGYAIGMISRNAERLAGYKEELKKAGILSEFAAADASNERQLIKALDNLTSKFGRLDTLVYNAVDSRFTSILEDNVDDLCNGFRVSVGSAVTAVQHVLPFLKESQGSIILTGGGAALYPNPEWGSLSLGKAAIRNLAFQLHTALKKEHIYAGTVTVCGTIETHSTTHSPKIVAEHFWNLNAKRHDPEMVY